MILVASGAGLQPNLSGSAADFGVDGVRRYLDFFDEVRRRVGRRKCAVPIHVPSVRHHESIPCRIDLTAARTRKGRVRIVRARAERTWCRSGKIHDVACLERKVHLVDTNHGSHGGRCRSENGVCGQSDFHVLSDSWRLRVENSVEPAGFD